MSELLQRPVLSDEEAFLQDSELVPFLYAPVPLKGGGTVPAAELYLDFADSKYGIHMHFEQDRRYSQRFGFDNDQMLEVLGPDVSALQHMQETGLWVARILNDHLKETGKLLIPEKQIGPVIFDNLRHDTGEPIHPDVKQKVGRVVGDIPAGQKKPHHRVTEAMVRGFMFDEVFSHVHPDVRYSGEARIMHYDTNSEEYKLSDAGHLMGTLDTANQARDEYDRQIAMQHPTLSPEVIAVLERLSRVVRSDIQHEIAHIATQYTFVQKYLDTH